MGTAAGGDQRDVNLVSGSFTGTGQSASRRVQGQFNVSLWGTFVGTISVERSFDNGATWINCSRDTAGTDNAFTAPTTQVLNEPENGVLYRVNCTAFTSGTINYRISQ